VTSSATDASAETWAPDRSAIARTVAVGPIAV
jgi:hypothetical protein